VTILASGSKFRVQASDWNDLMSMLHQWRRSQQNSLADQIISRHPPLIVKIKNTTANDLTSFTVLSLADAAINLVDYPNEKFDQIKVDGQTPTAGTPYFFNYAVLQEPCKAGGFADAAIAGATWVKLNITHASDWYCHAESGVTGYLTTNPVGTARLLLKSTGTGSTDKFGLAVLGDWGTVFVGKPNASAAVEAIDVVVNVWDATFSGATGQQVSSCYNPTVPLVTTDRVLGQVVNGRPILFKLNKSSQEVILDMRIKSGNTQIEANTATIYGDFSTSPAWEDKIELTSCPP
jgi:hypothetical protein